jgi:hypothetical protein
LRLREMPVVITAVLGGHLVGQVEAASYQEKTPAEGTFSEAQPATHESVCR